MAHPDPAQLRNVAVLGHRGSGKTSLVEAMLHAAGATNRRGRVADGTTVCDPDPDEHRRGMSISASLCHLTWKGVKVNLVDTPGDASFQGDTIAAMRAVDAVLMVVNGTAGVEVQTERLWARAVAQGLPRAAVVNMLDRERADFDAALASLTAMAPGTVAIQLPLGSESGFRGVVNLVSMTATTYADGALDGVTGPIPDEVAGPAQAAREHLIDVVAEKDDALIEKYLEGEEITTGELIGAILSGVAEGRIAPVVCAAGDPGIGIDRLLDLVTEALPSPVTAGVRGARDPATGEPVALAVSEDGPAVAVCVKTVADQFSGRISLLRVLTGVLASDGHATVAGSGAKERVGQLFTLQGKEHVPLAEIGPGDIGAVAKLKEVRTGDVLTTGDVPVAFAPLELPPPVMSFAVTAHVAGEEDKLNAALRRMRDEDPTIDVHHDEQTGDLILAGLSQMHVEVVAERIDRRFGVAMDLAPPHVPYRETITGQAEAEGKHKKQSGGRGQYADCWLRVEPLPRGGGFEFVDKVVGGAVPRAFIPAVEKGVAEALQRGELAGYPVVDVRVTLYDGKHHPVDSSEMAFKIAGSLGVRAAIAAARPVLLEPVMRVEITVPAENVGDVMGDLSSRRGHPLGMEARGHDEVVRAEVPMSEMLEYAPDLRAMTGGRGDYTMEFDHYAQVPAHLARKAAEEAVA
ncbi:elongation factor G [Miltoncostaea oceani]|uniref:elongation factor G n=1 Tax=Miltoncostaea oceani TaxID=2843216 RepID=UPI001C3DE416|nr:elongation factor G [Miltoncostaea oceani]